MPRHDTRRLRKSASRDQVKNARNLIRSEDQQRSICSHGSDDQLTAEASLGDRRLPARFWSKVLQVDDCWVWTAYRDRYGYAKFPVNSRPVFAHRHAFDRLVRPLGPETVIHHLCGNKACVNPSHLEETTKVEHDRVHAAESRAATLSRSVCKNGHAITEGNTQWNKGTGVRLCRVCRGEQRDRSREKAAAQKAALAQTGGAS
jgi:hypothetical protein